MKRSLKINNQEEKMNINNNIDYPYNEKDKHDIYKDINYNHINENINKNIIELNNCFMSNDIQNKLSPIMNDFKVISFDYVNDDDIENQTLGKFLYKLVNIARISYNNSNECLQKIYSKLEENNKNKESIIFSLD
jgi:hypothetical protein